MKTKQKVKSLTRADIVAMTPASFANQGYPKSMQEAYAILPARVKRTIVRHSIIALRRRQKIIDMAMTETLKQFGLHKHPLWMNR